MKDLNYSVKICRYCQYYIPEGRRGGDCQKLGALVQGNWKACCLSSPLFEASYKQRQEVLAWQQKQRIHAAKIDSLPLNLVS